MVPERDDEPRQSHETGMENKRDVEKSRTGVKKKRLCV